MQPKEDAFDQAEREHEARSRAAAEMAAVLGVGDEGPSSQAPPEKSGATSVDAGERTPEEPPKEPTGVEQLRNFLLYDADGRPRR